MESLRKQGEVGKLPHTLLRNSDLPTTMDSTACPEDNVRFGFMGKDIRHPIKQSDSEDYMDLIDY